MSEAERILLITDQYPPEIGSAANLFEDLGVSLSDKNFQVDILTLFPKPYKLIDSASNNPYKKKFLLFEEKKGLNIYRIRGLPIPKDNLLLRGLEHFSTAIFLFLRGLLIKRPQIILVYSPPLPLALASLILSRIKRCKIIVNIQDLYPQTVIDMGLLKNNLLIGIFKTIEKIVYQYSDHLVVHSESNKKYLVNHGAREKNVDVIYNWIDTEVYKPTGKDVFFHGVDLKNKYIVSYAGVFSPHQGLDIILDSATILKEHTEILFLFAGDGFTKDHLVKKANDNKLLNVTFLPFLSKDQYVKLLGCSDVSLVCLDKDVNTPVVPGKLMSIMACGKPVIATLPPVSDANKIIQEAQCGILVEAGDSQNLAISILNLKLNPGLMEKFGENGRKYAIKNFSLAESTNKYLGIFERLKR